MSAIDATGCESVYLTHGYTATFSRYLNEIGFDAHEVHTLYGGEEEENPTNLPQERDLENQGGDIESALSVGENSGGVS